MMDTVQWSLVIGLMLWHFADHNGMLQNSWYLPLLIGNYLRTNKKKNKKNWEKEEQLEEKTREEKLLNILAKSC